MLDFYTRKHPKAKKQHICDLCGKYITPGTVYHRYSGKYDGAMFDLKYCLDCELVIDTYCRESGECEYEDFEIMDWLRDHYCDGCSHSAYRDDGCIHAEYSCPIILDKLKGR